MSLLGAEERRAVQVTNRVLRCGFANNLCDGLFKIETTSILHSIDCSYL